VATHPIRALWQAGLSLSFHTDNQLISCLRPSDEAANLVRQAGFGWADLVRMGLLAAEASFLPAAARAQARQALLDWAAAEGLAPASPSHP
jgi:adenosine deaminase